GLLFTGSGRGTCNNLGGVAPDARPAWSDRGDRGAGQLVVFRKGGEHGLTSVLWGVAERPGGACERTGPPSAQGGSPGAVASANVSPGFTLASSVIVSVP